MKPYPSERAARRLKRVNLALQVEIGVRNDRFQRFEAHSQIFHLLLAARRSRLRAWQACLR